MKILVIGSGAREHALAWKISQSPKVTAVIVAPGSDAIAQETHIRCAPAATIEAWLELANDEQVAFTVVGPETPLAQGITDAFQAAGLRIFGPSKAAARLESSKQFAKEFMERHQIPTAAYEAFHDADAAHHYVDAQGAPIVIKADGLAAGKGVVVAMTLEQAHQAIDDMLSGGHAQIVIEEFMRGEEASFIVIADGKQVLPLASSQDHKRLLDNDEGPNTGGMGAYSPAPVVTPEVHGKVMRNIIIPTLSGLLEEGIHYCGFLYVGLMIDASGQPRVVEYNCRLGDPETQPILLRLKTDLVGLIDAALEHRLDHVETEWDRRSAVCIVLAAAGYPQAPRKGDRIEGLPAIMAQRDNEKVFHAGTKRDDANHHWLTNGGRVLSVTALGDNLRSAQQNAYTLADNIQFPGMQLRRDIGDKALQRKR